MSHTETILQYAKNFGATSADSMHIESKSTDISVLNGEMDNAEQSISSAIGLRVIVGKKQAVAHTSNLNDDGLKRLAEQTVEMAKAMPDAKFAQVNENWTKSIPELDLEGDIASIEQLKEFALKTEAAVLANPKVLKSDGAWASGAVSTITLQTSTGFCHTYKKGSTAFGCAVLAGTEDAKELGYKHTAARHLKNLKTPEYVGAEAAMNAIDKVGSVSENLGNVPVIFDKTVATRLLTELLGAINGANVARGISFLKDKKGAQLFQDNIFIIDDPLRPQGLGSKPFDAEGTATRTMNVVENGVLKTWLLDLRTAHLLQEETTGHASRGLSSLPSPSASNFYLKEGDVTVEELLGSVDKGFYVTGLKGRGGELSTGDYSIGAHGFLIENGKKTKPLSNITLAGHLLDIFKSLTPADDLEFNSALSSPTIKVDGFTVGGA